MNPPRPLARPRLGLIVPPAEGEVPEDARHLYGDRIEFIARGLGIGGVSPDGFAPVVDRIVDTARALAADGAQAVSMMGTSISFYRGAARTEALRQAMEDAAGVPCTTMSHAVVRSLKALGVRRVAVATSYIEALNRSLVQYLGDEGLEVQAIEGLQVVGVQDVFAVTPQTLTALSERVLARAPRAEGLFISCGGLRTHDVVEPLEARFGLPVTASSPAGFWDLMRVAGLDPSAAGFGRLFRPEPAAV
jgi:arylmalonate decarboxylase